MSRLVTFGCSNTFGYALSDVWDYKKNIPIVDGPPSKYAWPQLLADKLDLECVNLGIPGASNKQIWHTIINTEFFETDIVIILWSWYNRWCVLDKKQNNNKIKQFHQYQKNNDAKIFFKHLHTTYDMVVDFYLRCNHIETLLKDKIKIIKQGSQECGKIIESRLNVDDDNRQLYDQNVYFVPKWNKVSFLKFNLSNFRDQNNLAHDNKHVGPKTYEKFAMTIYEELL